MLGLDTITSPLCSGWIQLQHHCARTEYIITPLCSDWIQLQHHCARTGYNYITIVLGLDTITTPLCSDWIQLQHHCARIGSNYIIVIGYKQNVFGIGSVFFINDAVLVLFCPCNCHNYNKQQYFQCHIKVHYIFINRV